MSEDRGLTEVALPDLEALLRRTGTDPPSDDGRGPGLPRGRLDAVSLPAVLRTAIAERRYRPVPRVDLVWIAPEALVTTARDTLIVVRELFESAQKSVLAFP